MAGVHQKNPHKLPKDPEIYAGVERFKKADYLTGPLNIPTAERSLIITALNRKPTYDKAAKALCISTRTLYRKIHAHRIKINYTKEAV